MTLDWNALAMRLDPVVLMERTGVRPDDWQADLVRSQAKRIYLNCSRQIGKSTTVSALALHTAFYREGSTTLLLSPSQRQSQELFRKVLDFYRALDRPLSPEAENALSLELENHSRVVALPGKEGTIRGISGVDLLIIDEASRVPDALYKSVRPMLAVSGGTLVTLSTPFGTRGWWYEEYLRREKWRYFEIPATECPRISAEFLEEERERLGEWWFLQEYMCKFLDAETAAFREADIQRIVSEEVDVWAL